MIKKSIFLIFVICLNSEAQSPMKLWYNSPAKTFDETLLIGNGKQGATIYGGVDKELISLNDLSLWTGGQKNIKNPEPVTKFNKPHSSEKNNAVDSIIFGNNVGAYCPLGEVYINFKKENAFNYYRELSINDAVAKVLYDTQENSYYREYFYSYPDNALIIKINSKKTKSLNFSLGFQSLLQHKNETHSPLLYIEGRVPAILNSSNTELNNQLTNDQNGTRFSARILIEQKGGEIFNSDTTLIVENANEAIIKICMATSFNGYSKNPEKNNKTIANERIKSLINSDFYQLKMRHVKDYTKYFSRVKLYLGEDKYAELSTPDRLRIYDKFENDTYLESLFFQYARYLFISSSRLPGVPINSLGLWSSEQKSIQNNGYDMHYGIEENYWLAENTNLPEMHMPLLGFIENLEKNGFVTARKYYDSPGWVCHTKSDIWANTNEQSGKKWDLGGIIIASHLWKHYTYSQDKEFLKTKAYPIMKSAAEYALNSIIDDKEIQKANSEWKITIKQLFNDLKLAALELKIQDNFTDKINTEILKINQYKVDRKTKESAKNISDFENELKKPVEYYDIFPGYIANFQDTEEIMESAKITIVNNKHINATAWNMNILARLGNGNKAYNILKSYLKKPDPKTQNINNLVGVFPNLLIKTPENEIACNFGIAAGIAEMLLQSSPGKIIVLPALPDAWPTGSVQGLKAVGGFEVDISWENGKLSDLLIKSEKGGETKMYYRGNVKQIKLKAGKKVNFKSI